MNWTGNFFFCVATMSLTGSIGCLLYMALRRWLNRKRPELGLYLVKTILVLFLFPFIYAGLRLTRIIYSQGSLISEGEFGVGSSPELAKNVQILCVVWIIGLGAGIFLRMRHYLKLKKLLKENIPVREDYWYVLQDEACENYNFNKVLLCQNGRFNTPFVVHSFRVTVVLPFLEYTEKQMRMVMDHELNHIRGKDLLWRKAALVVSWLHWYNPLVYWLLRCLNEEQEIRCDIDSCQNTAHYTPKEYFAFMTAQGSGIGNNSFIAELYETPKMMAKRVEAFKARKKYGTPKRHLLILATAVFAVFVSVPAYAMSEQAARLEEQWLCEEEYIVEEDIQERNECPVSIMSDDGSVAECSMPNASNNGEIVCFDFSAECEVWYLTPERELSAGSEILVTAASSEGAVPFMAGMRNTVTGEIKYVETQDWVMQIFEIAEAGTYQIFIANQSETAASLEGTVIYTAPRE